MPPKKKPKTTRSQPDTQPPPPSAPAPSEPVSKSYDPVTDPWTDEQETALLKGIIKWKPVGMHKHFRMLAISEYMRSQGYAPADAEHTRIPGIWEKLRTLYNLPALDEREDALVNDASDDVENPKDLYCPFELPEDEFGEMMFERRLAREGSSSPPGSPRPASRRGSTVLDADEPRSSPGPSRGRRGGRGGRRGRRPTRLQVEIGAPKSNEEDGDSEETGQNEEGDDDGTDAAKEDTDGEDEAEGETGGSPTTRSTRAQISRSKQKDKASTGAGTRRTGRRH